MPFFLYEHSPSHSGYLTFKRLKKVALGGKRGPIAAHVNRECGGQPGRGWHLPELQVLEHLGGSANHALLIDLKPKKERNVSLYRLMDIWGFSYEDWTPVCFRLESLFIDEERGDAEAFKQHFELDTRKGGQVIHEFLYLRGGANKGTWGWGMVGNVNSALLFRDAWEYFVSKVRYE